MGIPEGGRTVPEGRWVRVTDGERMEVMEGGKEEDVNGEEGLKVDVPKAKLGWRDEVPKEGKVGRVVVH